MAKKELVNKQTEKSVEEFLASVTNEVRKNDALTVLQMMKEITGEEPRLWGKSIIGFGKYSYQRKNGDEFEWFNVGLSPVKAHLSLYFMFDVNEKKDQLERLGPHKTGKGCLYIKKLEQVDPNVIKELIAMSDKWER